jgi:hypothetical protein
MQDRHVIGVEALARFLLEPPHPPDTWFDAAHRVGLGVDLELTAVRKVEGPPRFLARGYMAVRRNRDGAHTACFDQGEGSTRLVPFAPSVVSMQSVLGARARSCS